MVDSSARNLKFSLRAATHSKSATARYNGSSGMLMQQTRQWAFAGLKNNQLIFLEGSPRVLGLVDVDIVVLGWAG